jgi:hypothetical protein
MPMPDEDLMQAAIRLLLDKFSNLHYGMVGFFATHTMISQIWHLSTELCSYLFPRNSTGGVARSAPAGYADLIKSMLKSLESNDQSPVQPVVYYRHFPLNFCGWSNVDIISKWNFIQQFTFHSEKLYHRITYCSLSALSCAIIRILDHDSWNCFCFGMPYFATQNTNYFEQILF